MTRLLKMLGVAMSAMAIFAIAASAAHAETGKLTAAPYPAILTGEIEPGGTGFAVGPYGVQCSTSTTTGTIVGPVDPVTLIPTFANCVAQPGATPVTVTTNGCDFSFGVSRPGTTGIVSPSTGRMQAWLICPAGKWLEIHVYQNGFQHAMNVSTCTYDLGTQGPVPGGIYHNTNPVGAPPDVLMTIDATFNAINTIGPAGLCGGEAGQQIPATVTGNYTIRAYEDLGGAEGAQIPTWID
ncbi:MAG TPA: hypothetical protein VFJ76_05310 [Solirubrobacterales bacterium]|nr:hypothetical protein [Solirubrobacterales bacterium]